MQVHPSTVHYACQKWRISRKKNWGYRERDARQERDSLRLRERYHRRGQQFVYIDESGFERETTRRYGRAPRGQPVHGLRPGRARPRTSLMAARFEGGDFAAPWLFEGTCNTDLFNGWLESQLCPLLHSQHVVILDNAAFHPSAKTRDLVARTGAT